MSTIGYRIIGHLVLLLIAVALGTKAVGAENLALEPKSEASWKEAVNQGTVRILTKELRSTSTTIASDMANVLNDPGSLRILPVIGHGSLQGMADLIYLSGIDLSILQADTLPYARRTNIYPNIDRRIRHVTKLYDSKVYIIGSYGSKTIQDLDGKLVSYGAEGSDSFITAENVFNSLGIEVLPVHHERHVAIEKVRQGDIAAAFFITDKSDDLMTKIEPGDGLHFLPVPITCNLRETYLTSTIIHEDYPNLVAKGELIETIAVPEVLAVYNWAPDSDRYGIVKSVVEKFLSNVEAFLEPVRHQRWQNLDLTADVPGWRRFQPVEEWLNGKATAVDDEQTSEQTDEAREAGKVIKKLAGQTESIDDDDQRQPTEVSDRQNNCDHDDQSGEDRQKRWNERQDKEDE